MLPPSYVRSDTGRAQCLRSTIVVNQCARTRYNRGYFTQALLKLLNTLGPNHIMCSQIIDRLQKEIKGSAEKLISARIWNFVLLCNIFWSRQSPQCEGFYSETRPIFQGYTSPKIKSFFNLSIRQTKLTLKGGEVHGFCKGDQFTVYKSRLEDHQKIPIATVEITKVFPHISLICLKNGILSLEEHPNAVALLTKSASQHFKVFVEQEDLRSRIEVLDLCILEHDRREAHIALSVDSSSEKQLRVEVVDRDLIGKCAELALKLKRHVVPNTTEDLTYVLTGLGHYYHHLKRTSDTLEDSIDNISVSFFEVRDTSFGHPRVVKVDNTLDLCRNNVINIDVKASDDPDDEQPIYGFEVTNNTKSEGEILFPVLLYFDNTNFTITRSFPHIVSGPDPEVVWPPQGKSMTIGYGVGAGSNVNPFDFYVGKDNDMEAGFFKLFLFFFENPVDLQNVVREEPLFTRSRGSHNLPLPARGTSTGRWGSITLTVIQRRIGQTSA
ncbi:hypothetical protein HYPSUDRAFT_40758 [Hypholoma sublateritium FD-334 SS-4]|uniref:Uncharacterized protein n=1 Tax=Hypholoma sublateritium (strain FD-334 SS-4) TaxID=945553 RepID=A0A0D2P1X0_HYPSF|nr:hypothetical protein HYPSUDRAFT_40758 [Hypholoma sublateritium FD-334 SS-4]